MTAVILDGGKPKYEYLTADEARKTTEFFINKLISELQKSKFIDQIILVTKSAADFNDTILTVCRTSADNSLVENINKSLSHIKQHNGKILYCTSDIPLVGSALIDDFIEQAMLLEADITYPIIPREAVDRFSRSSKRTFINLKDGSYTGGNVFLVSVEGLEKTMPQVEHIYSIRKSPKKLVKTLGILLIVKLLLRRLTIKRLEEKCTQIFGVTCKALTINHAELGIDVDKINDYEFVNSMLRE